uniref:Uncharacterized protein n=1 Tax=virus sp. ctML55 TaxID=2827627 RepID=A0A8S5RIJ6_9VIRU|nr:MAG TPA: hypothetical protein [virus sp. ctML55]
MKVSFKPTIGATILASINKSDKSDNSTAYLSAEFYSTKSS